MLINLAFIIQLGIGLLPAVLILLCSRLLAE